jgi:Tol biopolymer transport system component
MTPEQWHRVKEVFEAALGHVPEERSAFLGQACGGDDRLCSEVKSLLSSYEKSFMETPAAAIAAQSLVKEESAALVGQQLGHYQIVREIGRGGMGVVYLAQDVSLDRPVALKLLPKHLTSDPNRVQRFEREARAASALNHHNILTIYEIAQLDGHHSIATEFIDGVTLRERIKSKDLKLSETLNIAEQIASALVAAHEAGIVHRDIKPENVMIRRDGYVKVLDFGLAKLTEQQTTKRVNASAAIAGTNTDTGVMGTVGYMSPEQARGESVDHRTDIFSFGVLIYEMVTGHMPFEAKTAAVIAVPTPEQEPPPLAHYSPVTPDELQLIVNKALRQNRDERYQTTTELLTDLKSISSRRSAKSTLTAKGLSLLAATLAVTVGGLFWFYASSRTVKSSLPPMKVVPFTSSAGSEWVGAFSPDGNQIAFVWTGEKEYNPDVYVKQIGSDKLLRLTSDPAGDFCPVWSPDGQNVAFIRYSETGAAAIFIVPALGGAERKLLTLGSNVPFPPGWDWSPDGKFIAFTEKTSKDEPGKIFLISPDTLARHPLTAPTKNLGGVEFVNLGDSDPVFSPDGQSVAFVRQNSLVSADIYIVPIAGGEPRRLTFENAPVSGATWTADGREIIFSSSNPFVRNGSLWRIQASGGAVEQFTIAGYNVMYPHISRRGNRMAYVQASGDYNIYKIDVSGTTVSKNPPTKLIASTRNDVSPQFSPDGRRIVFASDRSGSTEIWMCDSDGSNVVQMTSLNKALAGTPRWSPDGQQIAFDLFEDRRGHIYVISTAGGRPRPITTGDFDDIVPSWSRNGKWIYFASNRTGVYQVWRVPAEGGEAVQLTTLGGGLAFESFDGKYVYYVKDWQHPGIWRVPVDGGEEVQVLDSFHSENNGDWAVVEDGLYFINPEPKDGIAMEFFDFATRKVRQVGKLGKVSINTNCIAVSPDRRQILYVQIDHSGEDIMLVENFH